MIFEASNILISGAPSSAMVGTGSAWVVVEAEMVVGADVNRPESPSSSARRSERGSAIVDRFCAMGKIVRTLSGEGVGGFDEWVGSLRFKNKISTFVLEKSRIAILR